MPDDNEVKEEVAEQEDQEFSEVFEAAAEEDGDPDKPEKAEVEDKGAAEDGDAEDAGDEAGDEVDLGKLDLDGLKKHIEDNPDLDIEVPDDATEESLRKAIEDSAGDEIETDIDKLDLDGLKKHIEDNKLKVEVADDATEEDLRKAIADATESEEDKADRERGEALLQEEADAKKKADDKKAEEEKAAAEAGDDKPKVLEVDDAQTFLELVTDDELPETLKVGDQELKLKEHLEDFPETRVIAGLMTQKILERLVENKTLPTTKVVTDLENRVGAALFDLRVLLKVSDAQEIVDSDKYKKWADAANEETKALLRSEDPMDFAKGLNKYKRAIARTVKKKEPDPKKKKKKEEHDDLHGSTLRQKGKSGPTGAADADDYSSAFKEATEKDEKE